MSRNDPVAFIKWMAQTIHQAYHEDEDSTWETCNKDICASTRKWIEDFFEDDNLWVTSDGKVIPIKEMEDSHLINAHRYLKRKIVERACEMQKEMPISDIDISKIENINFPIMNNLKVEIRRRQAMETGNQSGIRNLDI